MLDPHVSTRDEIGGIVLSVLGLAAQTEQQFLRERQRQGIQQAKAQDGYTGGKRSRDRAKVLGL